MNPLVLQITSRDNPQFKTLRKLAAGAGDHRVGGSVWLEGDHLLRAALARGQRLALLVVSEENWPQAQMEFGLAATKIMVLSKALFAALSALPAPVGLGAVVDVPPPPVLNPLAPTVVLDRLQDAGNVGAVLRCAAAFGFGQVIALKGTVALWSPKVVRAGMGAHWGLQLMESADVAAVAALRTPRLVTSSHRGFWLHEAVAQARLPMPCAWVLGHEGQGVQPESEALADLAVRIAQPGGEESLNVATAAAICLHASATCCWASGSGRGG